MNVLQIVWYDDDRACKVSSKKHPSLGCNFKSVTYRNAFCGGFKNFDAPAY